MLLQFTEVKDIENSQNIEKEKDIKFADEVSVCANLNIGQMVH